MEIDDLQALASQLPGVTFDIKWGDILTCLVANKMFCNINLKLQPIHCSIKVSDENYQSLIEKEGFNPAPYLARYNWVQLNNLNLWNQEEWEQYLCQAYQLTVVKLPKCTQLTLKQPHLE